MSDSLKKQKVSHDASSEQTPEPLKEGWISRGIPEDWRELIAEELKLRYVSFLESTISAEYARTVCFPPKEQVFYALEMCPLDAVRVVIVGQDPYHSKGQAHGLAFSVQRGLRIPSSLQNIFKEIDREFGTHVLKDRSEDPNGGEPNGDLTSWAKQGVLLLNTCLTVQSGRAGSHSKLPWSRLTTALLRELSKRRKGIVFMLWGNHARQLKQEITASNGHLILETSHPSGLSVNRGFSGCGHFKLANEFLKKNKKALWNSGVVEWWN